jgi:hypothetical protein
MDEFEAQASTTRPPAGTFRELVTIKLHSCRSTWHFQPVRMRFRRTGRPFAAPGVSTVWRPYYELRFEDSLDGFVVLLDPEGTRLVRASLHRAGSDVCEHCRTDAPSPDGVRRFAEIV